jgi:hypothetical protein
LADPAQPNASKEELKQAWEALIGSPDRPSSSSLQALMDAPATESIGMGMMRANTDDSDLAGPSTEDLDDEMSSSELEEGESEKKTKKKRLRALRRKIKQPFEFAQGPQDVIGVVFMEVQAARDLPPERNGNYIEMRLNVSYSDWLRHGSFCHCFFWEEDVPHQGYSTQFKPRLQRTINLPSHES